LGKHKNIILDCGLECLSYAYYNSETKALKFDALLQSLEAVAEGSIILLHAIAHNPTGVDPTPEQWKAIAQVIQKRNLFTYFDSAYQGFASGDLEKDSFATRHWNELGIEYVCAQSFAKNFGLYGTRTGAFHVVTKSPEPIPAIVGQLKRIIRTTNSNPPSHGARIIAKIVDTPELYKMWLEDIKTMAGRLFQCRRLLFDELQRLGTPGDWNHILNQIGMFTYTGLTSEQCENLMKHYSVFLLRSGRVSLAGINTKNVAYVAKAIDGVVTGKFNSN